MFFIKRDIWNIIKDIKKCLNDNKEKRNWMFMNY